jgi:hypothetical protein
MLLYKYLRSKDIENSMSMECWVVKFWNVGCNDKELDGEKNGNIRMIILSTITDIVENTGK